MDYVTIAVSKYINDMGISILTLAENIGRSYNSIYPSLKREPTRKLRGDEFLDICDYLKVDPRYFAGSAQPIDKEAM